MNPYAFWNAASHAWWTAAQTQAAVGAQMMEMAGMWHPGLARSNITMADMAQTAMRTTSAMQRSAMGLPARPSEMIGAEAAETMPVDDSHLAV